VFLKELWPTEQELQETMLRAVTAGMFRKSYCERLAGDDRWQKLEVPEGNSLRMG
jgi:aconitate hydratase